MVKSLKSLTTTIDVSNATAPTSGQVLMATSNSTATWQTPTSALTNITDLTLSNLLNGDVMRYSSSYGKWYNSQTLLK